jgi:hypothetical protein
MESTGTKSNRAGATRTGTTGLFRLDRTRSRHYLGLTRQIL